MSDQHYDAQKEADVQVTGNGRGFAVAASILAAIAAAGAGLVWADKSLRTAQTKDALSETLSNGTVLEITSSDAIALKNKQGCTLSYGFNAYGALVRQDAACANGVPFEADTPQSLSKLHRIACSIASEPQGFFVDDFATQRLSFFNAEHCMKFVESRYFPGS
ncbi:MAG: hypothetical protein KDI46_00555 [Alphaproteobacteria bacterium]|nr:hypothetical protein [Alphaproteobacteria bacterium]